MPIPITWFGNLWTKVIIPRVVIAGVKYVRASGCVFLECSREEQKAAEAQSASARVEKLLLFSLSCSLSVAAGDEGKSSSWFHDEAEVW
jgi:hypothetical protein